MLLDQLLLASCPGRHSRRILEHDRRLDHRQRRRIGGGLGAADLAEDALHLGKASDDLVGLLQELRALVIEMPGKVVGM